MALVGMRQILRAAQLSLKQSWKQNLKQKMKQRLPLVTLAALENKLLLTQLRAYEKKLYYWLVGTRAIVHYSLGPQHLDWCDGSKLVAFAS
jgi:hypothetical protein